MLDDITAARMAKRNARKVEPLDPDRIFSGGYRVLPCPHGIAVFGSCSLVHLHGMTRTAREEGFPEAAPEIASRLGATMVFVSPTSRVMWQAELDR
jgi:hypothetical protein